MIARASPASTVPVAPECASYLGCRSACGNVRATLSSIVDEQPHRRLPPHVLRKGPSMVSGASRTDRRLFAGGDHAFDDACVDPRSTEDDLGEAQLPRCETHRACWRTAWSRSTSARTRAGRGRQAQRSAFQSSTGGPAAHINLSSQ